MWRAPLLLLLQRRGSMWRAAQLLLLTPTLQQMLDLWMHQKPARAACRCAPVTCVACTRGRYHLLWSGFAQRLFDSHVPAGAVCKGGSSDHAASASWGVED